MKSSHTAKSIMMIKPKSFGFNTDAAETNFFQHETKLSDVEIRERVAKEFQEIVGALKKALVEVLVFEDTKSPIKPDAIFCNNWVSLWKEKAVLYPVCPPNRRAEKRPELIDLIKQNGFAIKTILDLSFYEEGNFFMESTGSMVFDKVNNIGFVARSQRSSEHLKAVIESELGVRLCFFDALDRNDKAIYHTNVMMSVAQDYAIVCLESIKNEAERKQIESTLKENGKKIIEISLEQVNQFAGNVLELANSSGEKILAMSTRAFHAFTSEQKAQIEKFSRIVHSSIETIEQIGGGGVRCMICEVLLEKA
jgi:hypothetical protein